MYFLPLANVCAIQMHYFNKMVFQTRVCIPAERLLMKIITVCLFEGRERH